MWTPSPSPKGEGGGQGRVAPCCRHSLVGGPGTGGLGNCTRVFSPPLAASGPTPRLQENLLGCRQGFLRWEKPGNSPLHMVKPPAAALRPQKEGDGFHGGGVVTWQRMVASHTNLCTHTGRGRGGGCGSISRVSRGSIIVFSLAVRTLQRGQYPLPLGPGLCPSRPRPPLPLPPPSSCPRCRASQLSILSVYETGLRPMESRELASPVKGVTPVPSTAPPPLVLTVRRK